MNYIIYIIIRIQSRLSHNIKINSSRTIEINLKQSDQIQIILIKRSNAKLGYIYNLSLEVYKEIIVCKNEI